MPHFRSDHAPLGQKLGFGRCGRKFRCGRLNLSKHPPDVTHYRLTVWPGASMVCSARTGPMTRPTIRVALRFEDHVNHRVGSLVWLAKRNRRNRSSNQKFVGVLVDCKRLWLRAVHAEGCLCRLTKLPSVGNLRDSLGDPNELPHPLVNTRQHAASTVVARRRICRPKIA
jgi:hypothetical protein